MGERSFSGWLPPRRPPEGTKLMVQILAERTDSLARLTRAERESERQLRAAFIRVGGYLGLEERIVIRFSETITGRAWSRCGAAQVVEVGKCLLDIAAALKCEHRGNASPEGDRCSVADGCRDKYWPAIGTGRFEPATRR